MLLHLILVRHGETEHNVAGLLAGVTDSKLTNHGVLQAQRLGRSLTASRQLQFTQIFASDLQRAWMTAGEISSAQTAQHGNSIPQPQVVKLALLREQDFGSFELVPWASKRTDDAFTTKVPSATDPDFKPKETAEQMKARADHFLDDFIVPILALDAEDRVAVVSHGLFLSALWRALLSRFSTDNVSLGPDVAVQSPSRPLEYVGSWTNTGYLELTISSASTHLGSQDSPAPTVTEHAGTGAFQDLKLKVLAINRRDHLDNLKRTRGVGSATHDVRQQQIDGFFKRPQQ
jgi:broad specificity phosphatase PhoE